MSIQLNKYFDNACTSFPKPNEVAEYMVNHLKEGGSYGRAAYSRIINSTRIVEETRDVIGQLIGVKEVSNIAFDYNATSAINKIINGFSFKHKKVLVSPLEHNAIMRPLSALGIDIQILPHESDGFIRVDDIQPSLLRNVDMVIVNHVSNVNGVIQPVAKIKEAIKDIPILVDASQSIGKVNFLANDWNIDYAVFTGHKGLLGPTGTGGFYVKEPSSLNYTISGGTGSNSDSFQMPTFMPDKFQAGTPNITGIYGLLAAIKYKPANGWDREVFLAIIKDLFSNPNIEVQCATNSENQSDVFSAYPKNGDVSGFAHNLFTKHGIEVRSGLHCSPLAHKTLGTFPKGSVRFSLSSYHSNNDIKYLHESILNTIE
ncbi:MAG: aminotransferase class V-fold PLP-dependent enzyme [Bacteroidales bacterium]|jgi:cysteine desulfurase family protein|nr:aminotransferase class V-fold PLP-dependent enzyme [Bacteroidales bacterium]MDD4383650.1 aminotransferase class V-fold PLP-dependent enzyme [Bacteroidales bacterium]MDY0197268.1 aminotransferase class V-fold PLP-dependent enzyme [Tenuifilaceae bacterium]